MRKFTLTYSSFREKSAEIEKYLRGLKLKENEIMGGLLILEEVSCVLGMAMKTSRVMSRLEKFSETSGF